MGTLLRMQPGQADVVLVVAEPSAKAIDVARRAAQIASTRARVVIVANKVRDEGDVEAIRQAVPDHELVVVPSDTAISAADEQGVAPIDLDEDAPGVRVLTRLAERLTAEASREPASR